MSRTRIDPSLLNNLSSNLNMGSNKITGLANGTASDDAAAFGQIPSVTAWTSYTPTFNGFGTVTNTEVFWKRIGDTIFIRGVFRTGTVAASEASFTLPSGKTIDNTKIPTGTANTAIAGQFWWCSGSAWSSANGIGAVFSDTAASTSLLYFCATPGTTGLTKQNGNNIAGSTNAVLIDCSIALA